MKLWAEVSDARGVRLGKGPLLLESASVTRALDGAGSFSLQVPVGQPGQGGEAWDFNRDSLDMLENERHIALFYTTDGRDKRLLGTGIIRERTLDVGQDGVLRLSVNGPDGLDELARVNTLLARIYNEQPVDTVAASLAALAGWTIEGTAGSRYVSARFDGTSVLRALRELVQGQGLHLREGTAAQMLEIGAFGGDSGVMISNARHLSPEVYDNASIMLVNTLQVVQDSQDIVNWMLPIGGGEGEAAQTLKEAVSTRTQPSYPYAIETMPGPEGRTVYYLKDDASIAQFGLRQKVVTYKNVVPVGNSTIARTAAANLLYDSTAADLTRMAQRQERYKLTCRKIPRSIRPGEKVRLRYRGIVEDASGKPIDLLSVDALFWVMQVMERVGPSGAMVDLEIAAVDRERDDAVKNIIETIETLSLRNLKPQPAPYRCEYTLAQPVQQWDGQPTYIFPATFIIKIDETVTDLTSVRIRLVSEPLYSLTIATWSGTAVNNWYQVVRDDQYPQGLTLHINDVDVTEKYGGPWNPAPSNAAVDVTLDITDDIVDSSGGFRRVHEIEVRCASLTRDIAVNGYATAVTAAYGNHGVIKMTVSQQGVCQAILST